MIVHRNNIILLPDLENHVSPIGVESLAFGQTSKLRFEISLIDNICTSKLCNTTLGS